MTQSSSKSDQKLKNQQYFVIVINLAALNKIFKRKIWILYSHIFYNV